MRDIARIAVEPDQGRTAITGDEPAVEHHAVRSEEPHVLELQTAVAGVFLAQDFVLFFIFWELELIPMYFLISIWGSGRKEYSAMKFLIFTLAGSASMLAGILVVFFVGVGTWVGVVVVCGIDLGVDMGCVT